MDERLEKLLQDFLADFKEILSEVKSAAPVAETPKRDRKPFYDSIRKTLFSGKLTKTQVEGMDAKLSAMEEAAFPVSWMAYALATSYHETATRMVPVREGLSASEAWRKKNLRYYPWYGRGDVQLTWESNYKKADEELNLGGRLVKNLDLALDNDISAKVLVRGMAEGWFSGDRKGRHTLERHLPNKEGTFEQFKQARRIINLMDKADLIANHAMKFQTALKEAGY